MELLQEYQPKKNGQLLNKWKKIQFIQWVSRKKKKKQKPKSQYKTIKIQNEDDGYS